MSISGVNAGAYYAGLQKNLANGDTGSNGAVPSQSDSAASDAASPSAASAAPSSTSGTPDASSTVTLSANAQAIAKLNAEGVTVEEFSIADLGLAPLSSQSTPDQAAAYLRAVAQAAPKLPTAPDGTPIGTISEDGFEKVVESFGGSKDEADSLFGAFDTDGDGSLSHAEVLAAMSSTNGGASPAAEDLLRRMDQNKDGTVDDSEFIRFETALVKAEKAPS